MKKLRKMPYFEPQHDNFLYATKQSLQTVRHCIFIMANLNPLHLQKRGLGEHFSLKLTAAG